MGSQYYDRGGPYGPSAPDMDRRRPQPPMAPYASRNSPATRSPRLPDGRVSARSPPQQYAMPGAFPGDDLRSPMPPYARSGSRGSSPGRQSPRQHPADFDQLPSPARPYAESSSRSNSPGRSSPNRQLRANYPPPEVEPLRPAARMPPTSRTTPPSHSHGHGQWNGDGYSSSPSQQYFPPAHMPYSQDYPPSPRMQQQRPPLGPPPSARKGPTTYYPQVLPVHPIAEEADSVRGSIRYAGMNGSASNLAHSSYASSYGGPLSMDGYPDTPNFPRQHARIPSSAYGDSEPTHSPQLDGFVEEEPHGKTLIREASVGKKSKPTLTVVRKSSAKSIGEGRGRLPPLSTQHSRTFSKDVSPIDENDNTRMPSTYLDLSDDEDEIADAKANAAFKRFAPQTATAGAAISDEGAPSTGNTLVNRTPSSDLLAFGDGLLPPSANSSKLGPQSSSHEFLNEPFQPVSPLTSPRQSRLDPADAPKREEQEDLASHARSQSAVSDTDSNKRRRPRLNVDIRAVRDAEARGSLTSLPDLIKRATQLATNLDRGKTASRLGLDWFGGSATDSEKERYRTVLSRKSNSTLDLLAAQPPPSGGELSRWSSHMRHAVLGSESDPGEKEGTIKKLKTRRCCGMPLWGFLLLLLLLILLIAAAVIVPIMLIVVPKSHHHSAPAAATNTNTGSDDLQSCKAKLACSNGGVNVLSPEGFCRCICVDGFTGTTCSTPSDASCTTVSAGSTNNATVGNAIPRLLSGAEGNFSIPLDSETILGMFSSAGMSCQTQNALVTVGNSGVSERSLQAIRGGNNRRSHTSSSDLTNGGIVYAKRDASSISKTVRQTSSSPSSSPPDTQTEEDFAAVAILYILQSSEQIAEASAAQGKLQSFFTSNQTTGAEHVDLGNGNSCDLTALTLSLQNGTVVGG